MSRLRVLLKTWLAHHRLVLEFCQDCGVGQPVVWTASDDLWAYVMRQPLDTDMGGVVCPPCFDRRATTLGIFLRWVPVSEP